MLLLLLWGDHGGAVVSQCRGRQSGQAVLVGLQEVATGGKGAVKAGGEASDVCGDVGEDTRSGLVVVGDLKKKPTSTQMRCSKLLHLVSCFCFAVKVQQYAHSNCAC